MDYLRLSLIQTDIVWENINDNLLVLSEKISSLKNISDLIILPEMFSTGFSMQPEKLAETMNGKAVTWMMENAKSLQTHICGSLVIKENDNYVNRFIVAHPDETIEYYDKRHLFRMGNEHFHYKGGFEKLIFKIGKWRICPLICYDLRFPVWARNKDDYDLLLFVANWPASRSEVWRKLLMARAIENQSYVAAVNRIGIDGTNLDYSGNSMIIDAKGNIISELKPNVEGIIQKDIDYSDLGNFRKKFPVMMDADDFEIKI